MVLARLRRDSTDGNARHSSIAIYDRPLTSKGDIAMAADPIGTSNPDEIEALFVQTSQSMPYADGEMPAGGEAALFIDIIGRPLSPVSVAGVHRRDRRAVRCMGRF